MMRLLKNNTYKNFGYAISTNFISLIISILITLIVPKLIGVTDYGYWQLYLFYSSYIGFLHLGWNDGILLRYSGNDFKQLNGTVIKSQFFLMMIFQVFIALIAVLTIYNLKMNFSRSFVMYSISICLIIVNLRIMLLFIIQGSNRIKEYAIATMIDRLLYLLIIFTLIIFGEYDFKLMIIADILAKICSLVYLVFLFRDIFLSKISSLNNTLNEAKVNIIAGISLMFSNIASLMILGVMRFGIEQNWNVEIFGEISLVISISNFLMVFITAISLVIFPILKKKNLDELRLFYIRYRSPLMNLLTVLLVVYYPVAYLLNNWLPLYKEGLRYLFIIFPIIVFEGKYYILSSNFYKVIRKERYLFKMNFWILVLSVIFCLLGTLVFNSITLMMIFILLLLLIRSTVAETILFGQLKIDFSKNIISEVVLITIFVASISLFNIYSAFVIFMISYILYILLNYRESKKLKKYI